MADSIYLDHNSTTPIDPAVAAAMDDCYRRQPANPASQHGPGRAARQLIETARETIAEILGAKTTGLDADQLIFTSGATEANNWALRSFAAGGSGPIVISAIEHPSIDGVAQHLANGGRTVVRLPVDAEGVLLLEEAKRQITAETSVVSVMLGNNETGVLQPIAELAAHCGEVGVPLHTDAVQVAGKLGIDFRRLDIGALTLNAHKCHGPSGIGALLLRPEWQLEPLLYGGFQQAGLRPGTEPVALAVGFAKTLALWQAEATACQARMIELRDLFETRLAEQISQIVINGGGAARLPHTSNVSFLGVDRQALLMALDLAQVACSTGSACASGSSEPSPVLIAMGCAEDRLQSSLRFSLGRFTTAAEVVEAARRISQSVNELRQQKSARKLPAAPRESGPKTL